jgi:hypothetical protein
LTKRKLFAILVLVLRAQAQSATGKATLPKNKNDHNQNELAPVLKRTTPVGSRHPKKVLNTPVYTADDPCRLYHQNNKTNNKKERMAECYLPSTVGGRTNWYHAATLPS